MNPKMNTVKLLETMMAFRPVSGDVAAVNKLAQFLAKYLGAHGLNTTLERANGRTALHASARKGKKSEVFAVTHLDVVPAEDELFALRRRGNWLLGRGVGDCLGNVAALAHALIRSADKADAAGIFTADEEIGGETAAAFVERGYKAKAVLMLDSHGLAPHIAVAQKAMLTLKLTAKGKACHGSTPWAGINAIDRLLDGYAKVRPLFPETRPGKEWLPTMSANVIRAGSAHNRVPDKAEMVLDIRLTEALRPSELTRSIRKASGLQVEILAQCPVVTTDPASPFVRYFQKAMKEAFGRAPIIKRLNGATDARHFVKLGVPILVTSLPYESPHASNERASALGLAQFENLLTSFFNRTDNGLASMI